MIKNRSVSVLSGLLALCLCVTSNAYSSAKFPVTVKDDRNKKIAFYKVPQRVASVSAFGADLLTALGKKAVALSSLNHNQPKFLGDQTKDMVDLGEIHETNLELLTELAPDLTIGVRAYTEPYEKKFEEIGHFLAYDLVTYQDSIRAINSVGASLGEQAKVEEINGAFAANLKAYHEQAAGGITAVFLWHWANVPYGYYDHHLTSFILTSLKVDNLIGQSPKPEIKKLDSAPVSMELLLKLDPDVIISFKGDDGVFQAHPVWPRLKAVKNNRAYRVGDQYVMPHGPIARNMVLQELAHLLYPKDFAEPSDIPTKAKAQLMTFTAN